MIRHQYCRRWKRSQRRKGRLKTDLQEPPHPAHRIPETLSLVILKMVTQAPATLQATTTTLQEGTHDKHHPTTQEWVVRPDKDILLPTPRHSVHLDMRDTEGDLRELRDTTITRDQGVHLRLGGDSMKGGQVPPPPGMICTTEEDGVVAGILLDQVIHREDHQQHHRELLHHPAILRPLNLMINIRKVEMGHKLVAHRVQALRVPRVGCRRRAHG